MMPALCYALDVINVTDGPDAASPAHRDAITWIRSELVVLDQLARLSDVMGPYRACRVLFGRRT